MCALAVAGDRRENVIVYRVMVMIILMAEIQTRYCTPV